MQESDLLARQIQLESLKRELDRLYHNTFDGPTNDFPRDDELELAYEDALHKSDKINTDLSRESQAVGLLISATKLMEQCNAAMKEALQFSTYGELIDITASYQCSTCSLGTPCQICGAVERVSRLLSLRCSNFFNVCLKA